MSRALFPLLFAALVVFAAAPAAAPRDLRQMPPEELIRLLDTQSIKSAQFYDWTREDLERVIGLIYLDAHRRKVKIDLLIGRSVVHFSSLPNAPLPMRYQNLLYLERMVDFLFCRPQGGNGNPDKAGRNGNVYKTYPGVDLHANLLLPSRQETGLPEYDWKDLPDLDGSTSTKPIRIALAAMLLDLPCQWRDPQREYAQCFPAIPRWHTGTAKGQPSTPTRESPRRQRWGALLVNAEDGFGLILNSQTTRAWRTLHQPGHNALVINAVSPDLLHRYRPTDPEIQPSQYECKVIGYDAFVAVANLGNPCQNLTFDQLRGIYSGKLSDWSALTGGQLAGPVVPVWRPASSGTGLLMAEHLFGKAFTPPTFERDDVIFSMIGLIERLRDPAVIGFSFYFYQMRIAPRVFTKIIAVNGVQPSYQTIADGSYPLRAPIYAAIHKDTPPDAPARRIFDFLTTPSGQKLVQAAGYVPVAP